MIQTFCDIYEEILEELLSADRIVFKLVFDSSNKAQLNISIWKGNKKEEKEYMLITDEDLTCYRNLIWEILDKVEENIIKELKEIVPELLGVEKADILDISLTGTGSTDYRRVILIVSHGRSLYEVSFEFYTAHKYEHGSAVGFIEEILLTVKPFKGRIKIVQL